MLIILLMFAPVRSVMAMQQTHCDMGNHAGHDVESSATISADPGTGDPGSHDMMTMSITSSSVQDSHDCCSGKSICASDCDMSISVSLLVHKSFYTPNFINLPGSVALITDLIKKEFTPPFRPPLVTHS